MLSARIRTNVLVARMNFIYLKNKLAPKIVERDSIKISPINNANRKKRLKYLFPKIFELEL